jgi:phosphohistidine phosphatase SixA
LMLRFAVFIIAAMLLSPATATEAGWALLREGGHVVLLRHAMTAGGSSGEPANFDINDCKTQRNLSERGREQADRLGVLFSVRGAPTERVLSSRYCRCLETASYAFDDLKAEVFEALDPLPVDPVAAKKQVDAIVAEVKAFSGSGNLVMITHKEVIEQLTGVSPREGEAVIVRADGDKLHALGRIVFD